MHNVGEAKVNVDMKPEAYWSDSESDNSTATNSVSTTPGSVVSTHNSKLINYLNGNKNSTESTTVTPTGSSSKVTFTSPKSASSVADKENTGTEHNVKHSDENAEKKGGSVLKPSPGTGILRSALKVSSNSSTFSYSKSNIASTGKSVSLASRITPHKGKKEVTVSAKSPTPEKTKTKKKASVDGMCHNTLTMSFVHVMIAVLVVLAFFVSVLLRPYLSTSSTHLQLPNPISNWVGTELVVYNPSKKVLLVDETDGACMTWSKGILGGRAAFSSRSCSSSSAYWSLRKASHGPFLQLENNDGKCLCPKNEFSKKSGLVMKACDVCSSGWSLDSSGNLHGGKLGATLGRKASILGKDKAVLNNLRNVNMAALSPKGDEAMASLKKFSSF